MSGKNFPEVRLFLTKDSKEFSTALKGGESFEKACQRLATSEGFPNAKFHFQGLKSSDSPTDGWVGVHFEAK